MRVVPLRRPSPFAIRHSPFALLSSLFSVVVVVILAGALCVCRPVQRENGSLIGTWDLIGMAMRLIRPRWAIHRSPCLWSRHPQDWNQTSARIWRLRARNRLYVTLFPLLLEL